jgi:hypothetical protein
VPCAPFPNLGGPKAKTLLRHIERMKESEIIKGIKDNEPGRRNKTGNFDILSIFILNYNILLNPLHYAKS